MINSFQAAATWADPAGDHRATTGWLRCPDLSGMSLAQATAALQADRLTLGTVTPTASSRTNKHRGCQPTRPSGHCDVTHDTAVDPNIGTGAAPLSLKRCRRPRAGQVTVGTPGTRPASPRPAPRSTVRSSNAATAIDRGTARRARG